MSDKKQVDKLIPVDKKQVKTIFEGTQKALQFFQQQLPNILPKVHIPLSQWSEDNIILSSEYAAEAGQFSVDRAPFQKGILDVLNDPLVEKVAIVAASQIGKTQMVTNYLFYTIAEDPSPLLFVHYSDKMAKSYVKQRLRPAIRDNAFLTEKINMDSRVAGNTLDFIEFAGGSITHAGSNSPGQLASRSIRYLVLDEVDRYNDSSEGDPVQIAVNRTKTYKNRKIIMISSPSLTNESKIWWEFEQGNQQYYFIPCPVCNHKQHLRFEQLKYSGLEQPVYECESCKHQIPESAKYDMLLEGEWIATADSEYQTFHINELYSPWSSWADIVAFFQEAYKLAKEGDTSKLQVFYNTRLALPWSSEVQNETPIPELIARCEEFSRDTGNYILSTLGIDVQDNRVECLMIGWKSYEESFIIDRQVFVGNPSTPEFWHTIEEYITKNAVTATCIDSGGHHTDNVYAFSQMNLHRRVWAIKGSNDPIRQVYDFRPSYKNKMKIPLHFIGTISAKDTIYTRLRITDDGGGKIHFHRDVCGNEEFFEQLLSEVKVKQKSGRVLYERKKGVRNEVLDTFVYALAAVRILNPNWSVLEKNMVIEEPTEEAFQQIQQQQKRVQTQIKPQSFAKRW